MTEYEEAAAYLLERTEMRPKIGIICGSGLSGLSNSMTESETFKYSSIPGFPKVTVPGHAEELIFGNMGGAQCVCMRGRFHFYEGNTMERVAMPVRVMRYLGVKLIIVTNAAGGLNPDFNVGDIMVIMNHFAMPCLSGQSPLIGKNDDKIGPRFPALSDAYDPKIQALVVKSAKSLELDHEVRPNGTYCFVSGPTYETRAEAKFLRSVGGDSVGMSTIPEIIAAKHCGMKILGLSLITNKAVKDFGAAAEEEETVHASHTEVLDAVKAAGKKMENLVKEFISDEATKQLIEAHDLPMLVPEVKKKKKLGNLFFLGALALLFVGMAIGAF